MMRQASQFTFNLLKEFLTCWITIALNWQRAGSEEIFHVCSQCITSRAIEKWASLYQRGVRFNDCNVLQGDIGHQITGQNPSLCLPKGTTNFQMDYLPGWQLVYLNVFIFGFERDKRKTDHPLASHMSYIDHLHNFIILWNSFS